MHRNVNEIYKKLGIFVFFFKHEFCLSPSVAACLNLVLLPLSSSRDIWWLWQFEDIIKIHQLLCGLLLRMPPQAPQPLCAWHNEPSRSNAGVWTPHVAVPPSSHTGCQQPRCFHVLLNKRITASLLLHSTRGLSDSGQPPSSFPRVSTFERGDNNTFTKPCVNKCASPRERDNQPSMSSLLTTVGQQCHFKRTRQVGLHLVLTTHLEQSCCYSAVFPPKTYLQHFDTAAPTSWTFWQPALAAEQWGCTWTIG